MFRNQSSLSRIFPGSKYLTFAISYRLLFFSHKRALYSPCSFQHFLKPTLPTTPHAYLMRETVWPKSVFPFVPLLQYRIGLLTVNAHIHRAMSSIVTRLLQLLLTLLFGHITAQVCHEETALGSFHM